MSTRQSNLASIVEEELLKNPLLMECLALGFCNVSGLAKYLKPSIDIKLKTTATIAAIGMTIRRLSARLQRAIPKNKNFPAHIDISARTGIYEVALPRNETNRILAEKVKSLVKVGTAELLVSVEGIYEIVIFASQKYKPAIKKILRSKKTSSEVDNLGIVTVNWPPSTKSIPGIYYRITRALAIKHVSIQSFHTIGSEMMILFSGAQFGDGYETIFRLLNNQLEI
jgi:hypothetical protein